MSEEKQVVAIDAEENKVVDNTSSIIQVIERAALNPDVDIEKMERLLDMQERILERNAEQSFNLSMKFAQQEMPAVVRDAKNAQTHSRYAKLESIAKAINPIITKHGFSMSFGTANSDLDGHYRVTCRVSHVDGHSRDYHADIPIDINGLKGNANKTPTHAFGSTMSYGRRYLTMLIFNVAITDEDDDGNAADNNHIISEEQVAWINYALDATESDKGKFCAAFKVSSIHEIKLSDFGRVDALIRRKAKERGVDLKNDYS